MKSKESAWVDLLNFQVSGMQPVSVLSTCGDITSRDASFNRDLVSGDVLKALEAAPTLYTLVVMEVLVSPTGIHSPWHKISSCFKSWEGTLRPAKFLTIKKPDP